jgi:threonine/homoserine/homoserine lactone efflux protein
MTYLLPSWPLLSAFLVASGVLAVSPGPGVLYIVTRSMVLGRQFGLLSVGGMVLGNALNVIAASVGLAALFAISSVAFAIVKYTGAAYLVYLGVQTLRTPANSFESLAPSETSTATVFRDGLIVALFNPKTTLFFAAFLPQFVDAISPIYQNIALGLIFVAIAAVTDSTYALVAASIAPALRQHVSLGQKIGGIVFICLGVFAALSSANVTK